METHEILMRAPVDYKDQTIELNKVANAVVRHLETLDPHIAPIGTTALCRALGEDVNIVSKWVRVARSKGMLDGYFVVGKPTRGTFGKPSYKWRNEPDEI